MKITSTFSPWIIVLSVFYTLSLVYGLWNESFSVLKASLVLMGVMVAAFATIYYRHLMVLSLAFLVPMSVPMSFGGTVLSIPSEAIALIFSAVLIWLVIARRIFDKQLLLHPLSILLLLQVAWLFLATLNSEIPVVSMKRWTLTLVFVLVYYFLFLHLFRSGKRIRRFYLLYALGLIIPIIVTLKTHSAYQFSKMTAYFVTKPFFDEHTIYATTIAFVLPFLWIAVLKYRALRFRLVHLLGLVALLGLLSVALFYSYSRAAWLSIAVTLVFYIMVRLKISLGAIVLMMALVSVFISLNWNGIVDYVQRNDAVSSKGSLSGHIESLGNLKTDASNTERLNRWSCAWRMFLDKPITGFGPGTYQFKYGPYQLNGEITRISSFTGDKGNAHSDYLMYLSESGLVALLLHLAIIFVSIKTGIRVVYNSTNQLQKCVAYAALLGLVSYFFHGLVNSFLDAEKAMILVYGSMAMLVSLDLLNKKEYAKIRE